MNSFDDAMRRQAELFAAIHQPARCPWYRWDRRCRVCGEPWRCKYARWADDYFSGRNPDWWPV